MSTTLSSTHDLLSKRSWMKRRPLLRNALFTDLQNGSYIASIYTLVQSIITQILSVFDLYVLIEASPGSTHYRYFGINFMFVYSGNKHVRNSLILCSIISFALAVYMLVVSVILMRALRKEIEQRFKPWLIAATVFTSWSFFSIIFRSIANDLYYEYHQAMLIIWTVMLICNVSYQYFLSLFVYSNFQELTDITRLEDMARLKMGTMSSLNTTSHSLSHYSVNMLGGVQSRASTPHGSTFAAV
ncbi:uncharacterized protein LOC118199877 [Stegodyphus dumicola]|uniref:uncharacterized protein LOC118199877 n=1 Tax=Stegodyphus dumicola TaxID=202533 RepID=UPI0015B3362D|nr:uncharacterized protein LOC118199877 [Stegodyphus dumicola]